MRTVMAPRPPVSTGAVVCMQAERRSRRLGPIWIDQDDREDQPKAQEFSGEQQPAIPSPFGIFQSLFKSRKFLCQRKLLFNTNITPHNTLLLGLGCRFHASLSKTAERKDERPWAQPGLRLHG